MGNNMEGTSGKRHRSAETMMVGLIIIAFGLIYMLRNMGLIDQNIWNIIFSWPMLLIVIGLVNFAGKHYTWGTILVLVGLVFLQDRFDGFLILRNFWPVIIILIGLSIIFSNTRIFSRPKPMMREGSEDFLDEMCVFGGGERLIHSKAFSGGKIVAVFGGSKVDMTQSTLAEGTNFIDIVAVFGGATLLVPNDWNVKMEVFNIFGGFTDKRRNLNIDHSKTLVIKGVGLFGGGELKSY